MLVWYKSFESDQVKSLHTLFSVSKFSLQILLWGKQFGYTV